MRSHVISKPILKQADAPGNCVSMKNEKPAGQDKGLVGRGRWSYDQARYHRLVKAFQTRRRVVLGPKPQTSGNRFLNL